MGVRVKSDRFKGVNVHLAVFHICFLNRGAQYLSDNAQPGVSVLILHKLTFHSNWQFIDNRCIHQHGFFIAHTGFCEFIRLITAVDNAEPVRLGYVLRVCDMDDKALARLYVLNSGVCFSQVKRNDITADHGAPCGVHHIDSSVFIEGGDQQYRHRKDGFGCFDLFFHGKLLLILICFSMGLTSFSRKFYFGY